MVSFAGVVRFLVEKIISTRWLELTSRYLRFLKRED